MHTHTHALYTHTRMHGHTYLECPLFFSSSHCSSKSSWKQNYVYGSGNFPDDTPKRILINGKILYIEACTYM